MKSSHLILLVEIIFYVSRGSAAPRDSRLTLEEILKEVRYRADELGTNIKDASEVQQKTDEFFRNVGQHLPRLMKRVSRDGLIRDKDVDKAIQQVHRKLQQLVMNAKKKSEYLILNLKDSPDEFKALLKDLIKQIKDEFHPMVTRRSMSTKDENKIFTDYSEGRRIESMGPFVKSAPKENRLNFHGYVNDNLNKDEDKNPIDLRKYESLDVVPTDLDNLRQDSIKSEDDLNYVKSRLLKNRRQKINRLISPQAEFSGFAKDRRVYNQPFQMPKLWTIECARGEKKYLHMCV